jgi:Zn-dependent M28 family amino/carboxypeptidase
VPFTPSSCRLIRPLALFLVRLVTCGVPLVSTAGEEARELAVAADNIRGHIRFLASDELVGRDSGEPGLEVAAEYIANAFAQYGLEPAGDNGTFFQHFSVPAGAAFGVDAGARLTLAGGGEVRWTAGGDVEAFGFSDSGLVDAPLAFAGYGITATEAEKARGLDYDDYTGVDVRGKVVILLRFTPQAGGDGGAFGGLRSPHAPFIAKLENAKKHGAAGVVFVSPPGQPEDDTYGLAHRAAPRQPTLPALCARRAALDVVLRACGTTLDRLAAAIERELKPQSFELAGARIRFSTTRRHLRLRNVAGRLPGIAADPEVAPETIVVGGHYDHIGRFGNQVSPGNLGRIHNGADDNASGTAAVLELARLLASGERPRRSVDFVCFSGEEIGLLGSRHWVNDAPRRFVLRNLTRALERPPDPHSADPHSPVKNGGWIWEAGTHVTATGSFQEDLVEVRTLEGSSGWVRAQDLKQVAGPAPLHRVVAMINLDMVGRGRDDRPVEVIGANSSASFRALLEELAQETQQNLRLSAGLGGGGSDHAHFLRKRIPALFFFTGMHPQYNQPDDDLETINIDAEARIVDLVWKTVLRLANAAEPPLFDALALAAASGRGGDDTPVLGIMADEGFAGPGVRVSETVPGTPAGDSQLEPGDVIVRMGDTEIRSLDDLRAVLQERPQGAVVLRVLRDGKERTVEAVFPRRSGGFRVSFGSVPDYGYSERGVRFEDIRPDTPAARAGVKPGDVLVRWNNVEVTDVEQWTGLLGQHRPGDRVEIEVRRGNESVRLAVKLEARSER